GAAPDREPPRPRLLEGLAVLLANLAEQAPVVVVLDDVHLADASSWDALHYLCGSLSTERILVVASARPGELADHPVAQRVLLDLEQTGALHRVEIGPLPAEAVRELGEEDIGAAAEPELIGWLGGRAPGNPLFVPGPDLLLRDLPPAQPGDGLRRHRRSAARRPAPPGRPGAPDHGPARRGRPPLRPLRRDRRPRGAGRAVRRPPPGRGARGVRRGP